MIAVTIAASMPLGLSGCDTSELSRDAHSGNLRFSTATTAVTTPDPSPTGQSHLTDHSALLLQAADLSDDDDTFAERSSAATPSDLPGASKLFVNADDTRAISVTVAIYPGAPTATATLQQAVAQANTVVTGTARPLRVGTDGTMLKGTSPDGTKAVTLVLFTQGPTLARLEFESAPGDATTDAFVTNIAKMQQIALRMGIRTDPE